MRFNMHGYTIIPPAIQRTTGQRRGKLTYSCELGDMQRYDAKRKLENVDIKS